MLNAVLLAVLVMLGLSIARVHVVLALFIGAVVGGLLGGLGLNGTMVAFQDGLTGGAQIALSYALLGAFAMAVASSGLPQALASWITSKITGHGQDSASTRAVLITKYSMLVGIVAMAIMSQNLIPVHIAFIPLLIPPLLTIMDKLQLDRRLVACVLTFGLVTTYMSLPVGFGSIFLNDILLGNIQKAGMDTSSINIMGVMAIPALSMLVGLLIAVFFTYRRPRAYAVVDLAAQERPLREADSTSGPSIVDSAEDPPAPRSQVKTPAPTTQSTYKMVMSILAIVACFAVQLVVDTVSEDANPLLVGALVGLAILLVSGAVPWRQSDDVFTQGMKMMALIGFIMISAQGFASVMTETGEVDSLVHDAANLFAGNKALGAMVMLVVGLVVTMGIGSSFSTLPIITTIYVPLCLSMGFSPVATVAIIGTAGALGDAGSPASDSTLGPTAGLNADGQHDHIRDSVIPTFLHFNIPLLVGGWTAAMLL